MHTDHSLIERLPGFSMLEDGRIIHDAGDGRLFKDAWQIHNFDHRHLTAGELGAIARARTTDAPVFLTPKQGRAGWNVRASFPKTLPGRRIPFLVVFGGEILRLAPTNQSIRFPAA